MQTQEIHLAALRSPEPPPKESKNGKGFKEDYMRHDKKDDNPRIGSRDRYLAYLYQIFPSDEHGNRERPITDFWTGNELFQKEKGPGKKKKNVGANPRKTPKSKGDTKKASKGKQRPSSKLRQTASDEEEAEEAADAMDVDDENEMQVDDEDESEVVDEE